MNELMSELNKEKANVRFTLAEMKGPDDRDNAVLLVECRQREENLKNQLMDEQKRYKELEISMAVVQERNGTLAMENKGLVVELKEKEVSERRQLKQLEASMLVI